jgi:hypothetical protein
MIRNFVMCFLAGIILSGCTFEFGHPQAPDITTAYDTSYDDAYYCEVPYTHIPEWCDYYDDGSLYCVWYVDGWYEEWYQWDSDYCWEYNGSW